MGELPPIERRTLGHAYDRAVASGADRVAHVAEGREWTFGQSRDRALAISAGLAGLGVGRQQPAALLLDNSIDYAHAWTGIGLGAQVEVPINTAYKGSFLSHILNDSGSTVIVIEDHYVDALAKVAVDLQTLRSVVVRGDVRAADGLRSAYRVVELDEIAAAEPREVAPARADEHLGYLYTSGTTGPSKGVLTSQAHAYTYASREDIGGLGREDTVLVQLPMFHLAGQWYGCYQALIHEAKAVIEPAFWASGFWDTVREHDVTYTILLGAMAEILQQQRPKPDDADNPLRTVPMAPLASDVRAFCERFGVQANAVYGMTEIGAVLMGGYQTLKPGEAGQPRSNVTLRIVDADGAEVPAGQVSELWVKPKEPLTVFSGYHNLPEKTAETIVDGWVHTGDAFWRDEDGHYYFADRIKDALRRRGENVSSFEVEKVINSHPKVLESAVVAVPSELSEDEIKAVVVPREGEELDPVELTEFLIDRMPYFMVPRYLETVDELPKTPTQKIQKHELRTRGLSGDVWDREAAGIVLGKHGRRNA
ncbi:AMP-binding protein [Cumulibacter manganitolerans]|uniref:AMP-binding protein n=1 Tax=Cumulibacter manganitolerans TaxID=1884992 RepID=UPI0012978E50|nr:AMP-binding protein [Cumulibacter manganitolerans]